MPRVLIRRAMTTIEIVFAFIAVSILATAIAAAGYGLRDTAVALNTETTLNTYAVEAARIAAVTTPSNEFPTSTTDAATGGITNRLSNSLGAEAAFSSSASNGAAQISVGFNEAVPGTLVLAVQTLDVDSGFDACLAVAVTPSGSTSWGYDGNSSTCSATQALNCTLDGSRSEPAVVDIDSCT